MQSSKFLFEKIEKWLKENKVWYEVLEHAPVKTSQEAAAVRAGVSLSEGAKAMVLRVRGPNFEIRDFFVMAVVPGDRKVDFKKVKRFLKMKDVCLATREEVKEVTGVEVGAVPPLGNLLGLKTLVDQSSLRQEKLAFSAGSSTHSVVMRPSDYQKLVAPSVGDFCRD